MRKEKSTSLKIDMMDKCIKIKHGIIWAYCAFQDKPVSLKDISDHYKISVSTDWKTVKKLIEIGAIESVGRQEGKHFTHYIAKKDTYYPSEISYD